MTTSASSTASCSTTSARSASPTDILRKPGLLSPEERRLMEQHPLLGYEMLRDVDLPAGRRSRRRALAPRALGRPRLPRRPRGHGDPASGADLRRRRLARRDDERPALPPAALRGGRPARRSSRSRAPNSTRVSSLRSKTSSRSCAKCSAVSSLPRPPARRRGAKVCQTDRWLSEWRLNDDAQIAPSRPTACCRARLYPGGVQLVESMPTSSRRSTTSS